MSALFALLKRVDYAFVTPTPLTQQRVLDRTADGLARDLRDVFGWNRRFAGSLLPAGVFSALREAGLIAQDGPNWKSRIRVSRLEDDLFVHSSYPTTAADSVFFGPDTYRFARAIRHHLSGSRHSSRPVRRAVDLCCGAGVGGVVIARAVDCDKVIVSDINDRALDMARFNISASGLGNITAAKSDLLSQIDGMFDLIVANPPYLNDALARTYRHGGGTHGSGLSLSIAELAKSRLAPGGTLLLYTGAPIIGGRDPFREAVEAGFEASELSVAYREVDPDVFGEELETEAYGDVERIAAVTLTIKNGSRHHA